MLQKIVTILFIISFVPLLIFAQESTILRSDGKLIKHKGDVNTLEVQSIKGGSYVEKNKNNLNLQSFSPLSTIDTLRWIPSNYEGTWVNFGFFGQDWMLQWFECPADLNLKKVGFAIYENASNLNIEVKIVKANWTKEQLTNAGITRWGYYAAQGNGYNDITAFLDNPDWTGGWTAITPSATEPFGNDIWSDAGTGISVLGNPIPSPRPLPLTYQWVDLSVLEEPVLGIGEIFGIAIKSTGVTMDAQRIGFWAAATGIPLWKYYANGRLVPGEDYGWWSRSEYTLDFVAEVELTGDRGPVIQSLTSLPSTIELGPFTVNAVITDDNPGNPANAGVSSALLYWSNDDGTTWNEVEMTGTEPNFTAQIPAQSANKWISYYVKATDVGGLITLSSTNEFYIFAPSGAPTLIVFNGFDAVSGYPQNYYFGPDVRSGLSTFPHDMWAYGPLPDFLNNYTNIIEICFEADFDYNDALIRTWLEGNAGRNYFLAGQEWLGARYNYVDQTFAAGDFEYDILGILNSFNDISYDGTVGQALPTLVWPQAGTAFGQPLLDLFNSLNPPADSMMYNPTFETNRNNWQDGLNIVSGAGVEVDMWVETRGVAGAPEVDTLATQIHRTLPAGNKIAFLAYDPIALNTAEDDTYPYYNWIGYNNANTPYQVLDWFGIVLDVKEVGGATPTDFSLAQNYPNPFNPSTTINFTVPQTAKVTLKVFDILGREVATLVNETKGPGNYAVDFDASSLSSGMYIYTINAGDFSSSKKMMLLK